MSYIVSCHDNNAFEWRPAGDETVDSYNPYYDPYYFGEDEQQKARRTATTPHVDQTAERSMAVSIIGWLYIVFCGFGVLQGALRVFISILANDVDILLGGGVNILLSGFFAYTGYALLQRENWARVVVIFSNYLNIALLAMATLAVLGYALTMGLGSLAGGTFLMMFGVIFAVIIGVSLLVSWLIISKLSSREVIAEFSPASSFSQDHHMNTFQ